MLSGKGKDLEEKIQEACKEINYRNLIVLIAVGDYVVNKAKNIKENIKAYHSVLYNKPCLIKKNIVWAAGSMPNKKEWQKSQRDPQRKVSI